MEEEQDWQIKTVFSPGTLVAGRYEVRQKLGAGGMGVVLRAIDRKLGGEDIALKILKPQFEESDPTALPRLINEVRLARSLTHPNIVRIHDIGETEDGGAYVSMEFIEGTGLNDILNKAQKGLPFHEAYRILCEITDGVGFAHSKGIIHRDLKPANILICKNGDIKIADFGIARSMDTDIHLTRPGEAVGTPAYMAPEQFKGDGIDVRCDVYALGILGYQLVTGELPFSSKSFFNLALQHMNEELPSLISQGVEIPKWYEELVLKASAKDKNQRFSSAVELNEALKSYGKGIKRPKSKKEKRYLLGAGIFILSFILFLAFFFYRNSISTISEKQTAKNFSKDNSPKILAVEENEKTNKAQKELEAELSGIANEVTTTITIATSPPSTTTTTVKKEVKTTNTLVSSEATLPALLQNNLSGSNKKAGSDLLFGNSKLYTGKFSPDGKTERVISLDLASQADNLSGTAQIESLGNFSVTGKSTTSGTLFLSLTGRNFSLTLEGTKEKGTISGTFTGGGMKGRWKAVLQPPRI
jgi:serine/threonine protein kinase